MSSFTGALILSDRNDGEHFEVYTSFRYYVGTEPSDLYRDVHKGFITNLASKPWFMRRTGRYNRAAVLHDALYVSPYVIRAVGGKLTVETISRKRCDEIFLEAMLITMQIKGKSLKVKLANAYHQLEAYTYYLAVRAFGHLAWANHGHA